MNGNINTYCVFNFKHICITFQLLYLLIHLCTSLIQIRDVSPNNCFKHSSKTTITSSNCYQLNIAFYNSPNTDCFSEEINQFIQKCSYSNSPIYPNYLDCPSGVLYYSCQNNCTNFPLDYGPSLSTIGTIKFDISLTQYFPYFEDQEDIYRTRIRYKGERWVYAHTSKDPLFKYKLSINSNDLCNRVEYPTQQPSVPLIDIYSLDFSPYMITNKRESICSITLIPDTFDTYLHNTEGFLTSGDIGSRLRGELDIEFPKFSSTHILSWGQCILKTQNFVYRPNITIYEVNKPNDFPLVVSIIGPTIGVIIIADIILCCFKL